ncbi:rRNA adenine N-6-methyltransferase family protein [Nocardiopsis ganjiahuensis]|uniref:rRNA adenine N-6-methyltransferase family protein n=1 Tax=Nocardiopsis ganjiahuensis TaxID=239984 RepID=UPI000347ED3D|nr:rRNA adenine N-6-methyltransferase family protein [Nocardiopsis ganjiahuensis]
MIPSHEKLVAHLLQEGVLSPRWRRTFELVERHRFLPDQVTLPDGTSVDRAGAPEQWLGVAYDDTPLITRVDDGVEDCRGYPSGWAPMPSVVADMLRRLDLRPGMRVLEVGTGIGYNTALLSHLLGEEEVTTIEADPTVAEQARVNLIGTGFVPLVVTGDGAQGWPARAPFDRVISTAAVKRVPYHWIAQSQPGGRILTPWGTAFHNGVLADLEVGQRGTASGRFCGDAAFMWARGRRPLGQAVATFVSDEHEFRARRTGMEPNAPLAFDASFAIGLHMSTVINTIEFPESGDDQQFVVHLVDPDSGSWASWHVEPGSTSHEVRHYGPRNLFAEFEAAYQWWLDSGSPAIDRFGMTVSVDQQTVWLDEAANVISSMP